LGFRCWKACATPWRSSKTRWHNSSCGPDAATLRHEQLFNLEAWTSLCLLRSTLCTDLLAFTDSSGITLQRAFSHAQRHLPSAEEVGAAGGFSPGPSP
ncbi:MAG: hypothetical protein ACKO5M_04560, partial [Vulcanococcus sp.]